MSLWCFLALCRRAFIFAGTYEGTGSQVSTTVHTIAVEDIAVFAALAFADPTTYRGKTLELAGDELTESQTAEVLTRVIGRPVIVAAPSENPRESFPGREDGHFQVFLMVRDTEPT